MIMQITTISDAAVEVRLHDGFAQGGDADGDTFESIERINGSPHDDTLEGDSNENALHGLGGDDVLDGREGNDWLEGDEGADVLRGGEGHDIAGLLRLGCPRRSTPVRWRGSGRRCRRRYL